MPLFTRRKDSAVQNFVVSLLNNHCPALREQADGPRLEGRVNLTMVVVVVPVECKKPLICRAFAATSKEFSSSGVALVVDSPVGVDEVFLGFRWQGA